MASLSEVRIPVSLVLDGTEISLGDLTCPIGVTPGSASPSSGGGLALPVVLDLDMTVFRTGLVELLEEAARRIRDLSVEGQLPEPPSEDEEWARFGAAVGMGGPQLRAIVEEAEHLKRARP